MSQENVEMVRSMYEAVNRRDWDRAFRDQAEDVELVVPPGINRSLFRGREECQGYIEEMFAAFEGPTFQPEKVLERGDQVAVVVRIRARPKGSSAEIEIRNGHLWTIRDGKAQSMRIFPAPEDALEAAGLSE